MNKKKLLALLASGALVFGMAGMVSAASVDPILHDGNITVDGNGGSDAADCDPDDAVQITPPDTEGTTANGATVHVTYHGGDNGFDFTVENGLVTIAYVKGGNAYNEYNYGLPGVAADTDLYAPDNGSEGPAGISHLVFCTVFFESSEEAETEPTTSSLDTSGTSAPADGAWLLVVALGVLLASVVVLTPARAKSRR